MTTFAVKDWRDWPDTSTPTSAAAIEDQETRLAAYTEQVQGDFFQRGVVSAGDCDLTINSTSSVTIAVGTVWVPGAAGALVRTAPGSTTLSSIATATNARLDQIVVSEAGVVTRLAGTTDSAGNTLANRTGAAAIPSGSMLLHDLLVTSGGVTAPNVRDRRGWARGAFHHIQRDGTANYTTTSASYAQVDATNLQPRLECSGLPLRISIACNASGSNSAAIVRTAPSIDGIVPIGWTQGIELGNGTANTEAFMSWSAVYTPTAGSHQVGFKWLVAGGAYTATIYNTAGYPVLLTVEEITRQNANNG